MDASNARMTLPAVMALAVDATDTSNARMRFPVALAVDATNASNAKENFWATKIPYSTSVKPDVFFSTPAPNNELGRRKERQQGPSTIGAKWTVKENEQPYNSILSLSQWLALLSARKKDIGDSILGGPGHQSAMACRWRVTSGEKKTFNNTKCT